MSDSFVTPWIVAHQAPLSMEFSRQEYWSGLPFPSPGNLSNPGIEPNSTDSPTLQADSLPLSHQVWSKCKVNARLSNKFSLSFINSFKKPCCTPTYCRLWKDWLSLLESLQFSRGFPLWLSWWRIRLQAGDVSAIPGLGRSPGDRKGYPL